MLNDSIDNIRLDINNEKVRACVYVRKGDTKVRTLHITLADNGKVISLANAVTAEILIAKADGYKTDQGAVVVGNEIQYTLRTQDISAVGENLVQVCVTFSDAAQITSSNFSLMVYEKNIDSRVLTSTNEYTALGQQVAQAKIYADSAGSYADNASSTLEEIESAKDDFDTDYEDYIASMEAVKADVDNIKTSVTATAAQVETSVDTAKGYSDTAKGYSDEAEASAESASEYATLVEADTAIVAGYKTSVEGYKSAVEATKSEVDSVASSVALDKQTTEGYKNAASASASAASASATSASTSESNASEYKEGAKDYYELTKEIAESVGGGLVPCGTITPEQISEKLSTSLTGYMYNINGAFITDDTFVEGVGVSVPAGSNIYKTNDGKWDILSAQIVAGVKGDAEAVYRQGNINITAANIGLGNVDNTADADKSVSHASTADTATNAGHATTADSATSATSATNASHATTADSATTTSTTGTSEKASTKMFLLGAETQATSATSYSNAACYIGTDNELYSNGKKVAHSDDTPTLPAWLGYPHTP